MSYVYSPDSGSPFNCAYGTILSGVRCTQRWTPKEEPLCPDQTLIDLDSRLLEPEVVVTYASGISSDFVVDGC